MIGTIQVDLDKVDYLLRNDDCPVSLGVRLDTAGKERLLMMFISTDYIDDATAFAEKLVIIHKTKSAPLTFQEMDDRIERLLGANGFVYMNFVDLIPRYVTRCEDGIWLFTWSEENRWKKVRELKLQEPTVFDEFIKDVGFSRLTDRAAEEYHTQNRFNTPLEDLPGE